MGVLFGTIGKAVWVAGLQQVMVVLSGVFMLFMAFYAYKLERITIQIPIMSDLFRRLADAMRPLLLQPSYSNAYTIGVLNGLIPCGLVYTAIFSSLTTAGPLEGALFMAAFGLGTVPLMLSLSVGGQFLRRYVKGSWRGWQPLLLCIVGVLAIWRGLHLDLDFFHFIVPRAEYKCH
jgi:sulfite exporter TauE/SafE